MYLLRQNPFDLSAEWQWLKIDRNFLATRWPMAIDQRAISAAQNNADWYAAVFAAHGLKFERLPNAFIGRDAAPPYYANLTVTSPEQRDVIMSELAQLLERLDGKLALKDSFNQFELHGNGFETLFEASWIWRNPESLTMPDGWGIVKEADQLVLWEDSWKRNGSPTDWRMFPETLLDRQDVFFLGRRDQDRFVAGCIANRSDDCMGLSNVFSEDRSRTQFSDAVSAATSIDDSCALVGYEAGRELDHAMQSGFQTVGDLRILVARNAEL